MEMKRPGMVGYLVDWVWGGIRQAQNNFC
jgi:hypothetical protein